MLARLGRCGPRATQRVVSMNIAPMSAASINHHREGAGPPLVLLHGIGQQLAGMATGDRAARGRVRRDRVRLARLRPLAAAGARRGAHDPGLCGCLRALLRRARARAPARRRQLDGRSNRARAGAPPRGQLGERVLPGRLLDRRGTALLPGLARRAGRAARSGPPGRCSRSRAPARGAPRCLPSCSAGLRACPARRLSRTLDRRLGRSRFQATPWPPLTTTGSALRRSCGAWR